MRKFSHPVCSMISRYSVEKCLKQHFTLRNMSPTSLMPLNFKSNILILQKRIHYRSGTSNFSYQLFSSYNKFSYSRNKFKQQSTKSTETNNKSDPQLQKYNRKAPSKEDLQKLIPIQETLRSYICKIIQEQISSQEQIKFESSSNYKKPQKSITYHNLLTKIITIKQFISLSLKLNQPIKTFNGIQLDEDYKFDTLFKIVQKQFKTIDLLNQQLKKYQTQKSMIFQNPYIELKQLSSQQFQLQKKFMQKQLLIIFTQIILLVKILQLCPLYKKYNDSKVFQHYQSYKDINNYYKQTTFKAYKDKKFVQAKEKLMLIKQNIFNFNRINKIYQDKLLSEVDIQQLIQKVFQMKGIQKYLDGQNLKAYQQLKYKSQGYFENNKNKQEYVQVNLLSEQQQPRNSNANQNAMKYYLQYKSQLQSPFASSDLSPESHQLLITPYLEQLQKKRQSRILKKISSNQCAEIIKLGESQMIEILDIQQSNLQFDYNITSHVLMLAISQHLNKQTKYKIIMEMKGKIQKDFENYQKTKNYIGGILNYWKMIKDFINISILRRRKSIDIRIRQNQQRQKLMKKQKKNQNNKQMAFKQNNQRMSNIISDRDQLQRMNLLLGWFLSNLRKEKN